MSRAVTRKPTMREHVGGSGMIIVRFNGREAMFFQGQRYRCRVNGIELPSTHAGHVAAAVTAAFAAGARLEYEDESAVRVTAARTVGPTIEFRNLPRGLQEAALPG